VELDLQEAFDKHEAAFFVSTERRDLEGNLLLLIAIARESGFYATVETLGKDLKIATLIIKKRNRFIGISKKAANNIFKSSIYLQFDIMEIYDDLQAQGPDHEG